MSRVWLPAAAPPQPAIPGRSPLVLRVLVVVLGATVIAGGGVLVGAAGRARVTYLTPSFASSARAADVVEIRPAPAALPAEPSRPIDVPADPYAPEPVVELGRIQIPKLGLDHRLMQGVTLNNIDQGPSHWPGTAYPGQAGNSVIAGHRVTHSRPFRNLDQLVPGDQIVVTARGVRATYAVAETFIVTPDQVEIADPTPTPSLTLFACHPPYSARQRIVVRGQLAGVERA